MTPRSSLPTLKSNDEGSARYLMQVRRKLICRYSTAPNSRSAVLVANADDADKG
jgi:hypothetical protein